MSWDRVRGFSVSLRDESGAGVVLLQPYLYFQRMWSSLIDCNKFGHLIVVKKKIFTTEPDQF